jgi:hypothetical protein
VGVKLADLSGWPIITTTQKIPEGAINIRILYDEVEE